MPRKKTKVEVLAPILRPSVPAAVGKAVEQLVEQKIAEVLSQRDQALFEPWFRSLQEAHAIKRRQSVPEQRKWSVFYDRHGCLSCHTDKHPHAGGGLCAHCRPKIASKLKAIVNELLKVRAIPPPSG